MSAYIDQSNEQVSKHLYVSNLPPDVNAKRITDFFQTFGVIVKLYLKRRVSKNSPILLRNPFVILIFERQESVDEIMANRPYFMSDYQLFVRRCLPFTGRYAHETVLNTNKMLVRMPRQYADKILPNDDIIREYLKAAGGNILRLERFDEQTVLVEFDDYDPVDICCLSRPHFINDQLIDVEKCRNEELVRHYAQIRQQAYNTSVKASMTSTTMERDIQPCDTISSTPTLNHDEQRSHIELKYDAMSNRLEDEHEQLISSLKTEWKQLMKERIRLQRLTLDYQQECERIIEENRQWEKLCTDELQEGLRIQSKDKSKLSDTT